MGRALRHGRKIATLLASGAYRRGLRHGVAASIEHESVPFQHRFATVIDVGAGKGQFALFAHRRFPDAALYCFEPLPDSAARLRRVVERLAGAKAYEMALGSTGGRHVLHVSRSADSSSLLPIGARHLEAFPNTAETGKQTVEVETLDDVLDVDRLKRPTLLKVDVQGYELEVLHGAAERLSLIDELLVECSFVELYDGQPLAGDVVTYLQQREFRLAHVSSPLADRDGMALQADFHFIGAE